MQTTVKNSITAFFIRHPEFFIDVISQYYPLSKVQLTKYRKQLKWCFVSSNKHINWDISILDKYKKLLYWKSVTLNEKAINNTSLLERYDDLIDWTGDEDYMWDTILMNKAFLWDINLIEKYKSKISFHKLSSCPNVLWSEELIDKYLEK
jgi:hypothetical protein